MQPLVWVGPIPSPSYNPPSKWELGYIKAFLIHVSFMETRELSHTGALDFGGWPVVQGQGESDGRRALKSKSASGAKCPAVEGSNTCTEGHRDT